MVGLYNYHFDNARRMIIKPYNLPLELSIYVVYSRAMPAECKWVLKNYGQKLDAYEVYRGVPWTQALSPVHGTGGNMDYTLMNVKKVGGGWHGGTVGVATRLRNRPSWRPAQVRVAMSPNLARTHREPCSAIFSRVRWARGEMTSSR